jgi:hypothetical protein
MIVVDDRQMQPTTGGDRRAQSGNERGQRDFKGMVLLSDAAAEPQQVTQERCGEVHIEAPRKRILP